MKKIFRKIKTFFSRILLGILLISSVIITFYMFPHLGKFPYEYQQGSPWMHENLIPEFDFPIFKSAEEVALERDSILSVLKPYFISDPTIGEQKTEEFREVFPATWSRFVSKTSIDTIFSEEDLRAMEIN